MKPFSQTLLVTALSCGVGLRAADFRNGRTLPTSRPGGANGTQFWLHLEEQFYAIFMVQTQRYRAPTYNDFRRLASEAAGINSTRGRGMAGQGVAGRRTRPGDPFKQRDKNGDGKLDRDEVPELLFKRLDADRDGFISEEEAKRIWRPQR